MENNRFENYATAKTFWGWERIGEPYKKNFKYYIHVKNPANGQEREVRLYDSASIHSMYGDEYVSVTLSRYQKTQKEVLGFDDGFIWIFKGDTYKHLDWFRESPCKYNKWFGWHCSELPVDYPIDLTPVKVEWASVGDDSGKLLPDDRITLYLDSLLYDEDPSEFQGEVGDKITRDVIITDIKTIDSRYGVSTIYSFMDNDKNRYQWITSVNKDVEVGDEVSIAGAIKELKTFRNMKITTMTRVRMSEVK